MNKVTVIILSLNVLLIQGAEPSRRKKHSSHHQSHKRHSKINYQNNDFSNELAELRGELYAERQRREEQVAELQKKIDILDKVARPLDLKKMSQEMNLITSEVQKSFELVQKIEKLKLQD